MSENPYNATDLSESLKAVAAEPPAAEDHRQRRRVTPKYLKLKRVECRFTHQAVEKLTKMELKLNKRRIGGTRLTKNDLIRVAVDVLLEHSAQLEGTTEAELLASYRKALEGLGVSHGSKEHDAEGHDQP